MSPSLGLDIGDAAVTITDDLRVRSRPEVSDASIKYEPTLPYGTHLTITDGPLAGSGMWWYEVALDAVTLEGGVDHGWVAAGPRGGTPWIMPYDTLDAVPGCEADPDASCSPDSECLPC